MPPHLALLDVSPMVTQPVPIFFIVLVIILTAPLLLNKLKIPHIIGMIVAGVVIGPHGLNVLAADESFSIFGQVGLLYLMFLAGLEIDMFHLRLNLRRGLFFGIMTLLIPLGLGVVTSYYILGLDLLTSMLLGAMYASHTLISYPVAARLGITKAPAVIIAVVGTIIAVVGALLVIAGTVSVARSGEFSWAEMLALLGRIALYCLCVLYAYPRITRYFFKRHADKVLQYVFVMAMVFLSAWLAQLIGLEAILGAFFAGLVLNRYVPAASPLMGSIEFVGNALFIPYFLIRVGMMINLNVVFEQNTLIIASLMIAVALVSKWLPAYLCQKLSSLDKHSLGVIYGLTSAHTAVALAVVALGNTLGMLDERILNSTVLVILVTCAVAPIVTAISAPRLRISMLKKEEETGVESTSTGRRMRLNNTLIAVPNPQLATALVDMAMLMRNDRGKHNFYALHVRNDNNPAARVLSQKTLKVARHTAAAASVTLEAIDRYDLNTVTGVLNTIEERDITEIILGLHRRSAVLDSIYGNKVDTLLRSTNRMVIITRMYIPVYTVTRIIVYAPPRAQYETGFSRWVRAVARLTRQIGCRAIFCCPDEIQPHIRGVIYQENYGIRCEFRQAEDWDDFILISGKILNDDLLIVIGARVNSVSYNQDIAGMPTFLQRSFATTNIAVIYPEQFGTAVPSTTFVDPMASDITTASSPLWRRLRALLHPRRT